MAKKKPIPKSPPRAKRPTASSGDHGYEDLLSDVGSLAGALQALFTIEGVEDIGQPVTLISPADLPVDMLCFVERLRCGAVELDEEMLVITFTRSGGRRKDPTIERLREAFTLLCRYASEKGVADEDLVSLLDQARLKARPAGKRPKDRK